jgi:hypothetical protein
MGINNILKAGQIGVEEKPDLTEVKSLVRQFAEAWWAEKDAKQRKDKLRQQIIELHRHNGIDLLDGDEGVVKIVMKSDSIGFIAKAAKELLTEEQIQKCTGVTRKGGLTVEFTPAAKRPE